MKLSERFWLAVGIVLVIALFIFVPYNPDNIRGNGNDFVEVLIILGWSVKWLISFGLFIISATLIRFEVIPKFNNWLDKMDKS